MVFGVCFRSLMSFLQVVFIFLAGLSLCAGMYHLS